MNFFSKDSTSVSDWNTRQEGPSRNIRPLPNNVAPIHKGAEAEAEEEGGERGSGKTGIRAERKRDCGRAYQVSRGERSVTKTVEHGLDRTGGKKGAQEDREMWERTENTGTGWTGGAGWEEKMKAEWEGKRRGARKKTRQEGEGKMIGKREKQMNLGTLAIRLKREASFACNCLSSCTFLHDNLGVIIFFDFSSSSPSASSPSSLSAWSH